jgi:hypothetical protein
MQPKVDQSELRDELPADNVVGGPFSCRTGWVGVSAGMLRGFFW